MEVSGELHAPTAFLTGKTPVTIEMEAGWTPVTVRRFLRNKNLSPDRHALNLVTIPTALPHLL
jgi:hypothetical protein